VLAVPDKTAEEDSAERRGVALDDVLIIEDPFGGRRRTLFRSTYFGEIRATLMDPLTGVFDPLEQFIIPSRPWVHFVVHGQVLNMLLDLCRRERHSKASHFSNGILSLRVQHEDGGGMSPLSRSTATGNRSVSIGAWRIRTVSLDTNQRV